MIAITKGKAPSSLVKAGQAAAKLHCDAYSADPDAYKSGRLKMKFKESIYKSKPVQTALQNSQLGKCAFCESRFSSTSYGHVEHFRPKGGYKRDLSDSLRFPGYYWVAYSWDNLFNSCQICNQQFKGNVFPLRNENHRACSHADTLAKEEPLLIDPGNCDPTTFIGFHREIPYAIGGCEEGLATISTLGLDRDTLNEERRERLESLEWMISYRQLVCDLSRESGENSSNAAVLAAELEADIQACVESSGEYSAMARCYIASRTGA